MGIEFIHLGAVSPRIARIRIVRIHYNVILFLSRNIQIMQIPQNSVITEFEIFGLILVIY